MSRQRVGLRIAAACLALCAAALPAAAQLTRGIISGTVTDAGGGVLPGVTVTVTNQETGVARTTRPTRRASIALRRWNLEPTPCASNSRASRRSRPRTSASLPARRRR